LTAAGKTNLRPIDRTAISSPTFSNSGTREQLLKLFVVRHTASASHTEMVKYGRIFHGRRHTLKSAMARAREGGLGTLVLGRPTYFTHITRHVRDGQPPTRRPTPNGQRDGRPAEYRWRHLRKFRNSIPCTTPQSLADARCWNAVQ